MDILPHTWDGFLICFSVLNFLTVTQRVTNVLLNLTLCWVVEKRPLFLTSRLKTFTFISFKLQEYSIIIGWDSPFCREELNFSGKFITIAFYHCLTTAKMWFPFLDSHMKLSQKGKWTLKEISFPAWHYI